MQDLSSGRQAIIQAMGTDTQYKDSQAYDANIDFDNRIMRSALPITRMTNKYGALDMKVVKNAKPFPDASEMWEQMNNNMPRGRGIDSKVFMEKQSMGKQMYDMGLSNQIGQMQQNGMSEKAIWNTFGENDNGMRQYMVENGLLQPRLKSQPSAFGTVARTAGVVGAISGANSLKRFNKVPNPTPDQLSALKEAGYKYDKNGIQKLTAKELARDDLKNLSKNPKKPLPAEYKFGKGTKKKPIAKTKQGKPNKSAYTKALKQWNENSKLRRIEAKAIKKAASDAIKARNARDVSFFGKRALEKGASGLSGRIASNIALNSVGKTIGMNVGKGLGMKALGFMGGPLGLAITGGLTAWDLYSRYKEDNSPTVTSRWK